MKKTFIKFIHGDSLSQVEKGVNSYMESVEQLYPDGAEFYVEAPQLIRAQDGTRTSMCMVQCEVETGEEE